MKQPAARLWKAHFFFYSHSCSSQSSGYPAQALAVAIRKKLAARTAAMCCHANPQYDQRPLCILQAFRFTHGIINGEDNGHVPGGCVTDVQIAIVAPVERWGGLGVAQHGNDSPVLLHVTTTASKTRTDSLTGESNKEEPPRGDQRLCALLSIALAWPGEFWTHSIHMNSDSTVGIKLKPTEGEQIPTSSRAATWLAPCQHCQCCLCRNHITGTTRTSQIYK